MKDKKLWIAGVVCGLICFFTGRETGTAIDLSTVVSLAAFSAADYYPVNLAVLCRWFMPLLVFQILYGTYIYQHFCSASVYFFSRNHNRIKWFVKESLHLYERSVAYLGCFLGCGIVVQAVTQGVTADAEGMILCIYYLAIHSLFLFTTTLAVNIISVKFSSSVGFVVVMAVNALGIACYSMFGQIAEDKNWDVTEHVWMMKVNPLAHLVFPVHSSRWQALDEIINVNGFSFDLDMSLSVFLAAAFILTFSGCVICERHEFIINNREI